MTDLRSNEELVAGPVTRALVVPLPKTEFDKLQPAVITEARQNGSAALTMTARSDTYEYRIEYRLPDGQPWFTRQLTVRNVSAATKVVQDFALATPPLRVGPGQTAAFPGSIPLVTRPSRVLRSPKDFDRRARTRWPCFGMLRASEAWAPGIIAKRNIPRSACGAGEARRDPASAAYRRQAEAR